MAVARDHENGSWFERRPAQAAPGRRVFPELEDVSAGEVPGAT